MSMRLDSIPDVAPSSETPESWDGKSASEILAERATLPCIYDIESEAPSLTRWYPRGGDTAHRLLQITDGRAKLEELLPRGAGPAFSVTCEEFSAAWLPYPTASLLSEREPEPQSATSMAVAEARAAVLHARLVRDVAGQLRIPLYGLAVAWLALVGLALWMISRY